MQDLFYVTNAQIEAITEQHFRRYGSKISFFDALQHLYQAKEYTTHPPHLYSEEDWHMLSDSEFIKLLKKLPIENPFTSTPPAGFLIMEDGIMPKNKEVFALEYIKYIAHMIHVHNYFELNYVLSGTCTQIFEAEKRYMTEGELCIIAPMSRHDLEVDDDSIVLSILLRESTFENTFFKLLTQEDLLSSFFRSVLYSKDSKANYLLFQTDNSPSLTNVMKDIFMETHISDEYSNTCVISRIHLLFSILLRKYGKTIQFYDYQKNANYHIEFPLILRYIQNNYSNLTLASLANFFHYSQSYLSRLIKYNAGRSFISIVTSLRMEKSVDLLSNTDIPVKSITSIIGYDSVDHFSRTFKKHYGQSPQQFRSKKS